VGDIGIMGKKARIDGKVVEAADVFVGGSSGPNATPPLKILEDVPCDELESVLSALLQYGALDTVKGLLRDSVVSAAPAEVPQSPQCEFHPGDIPEGAGRSFALNGSTVAVFKSEGKLFALQGNCPHADSPLADGAVDGTEVTCPEHGYRFDIRNGVCLTDPGLRARVYRLTPDEDVVRIEQPPTPVVRGDANGSTQGKER
jgi:nitrite reductase/ring-hydroxylating ferredoxin subunit